MTRRSVWTFYTNARNRVRALPGVEQAAWTEWAPLATVSEGGPVWLDGQKPRTGEQGVHGGVCIGRCGLLHGQQGHDSRGTGVRRSRCEDRKAGRDRQRNARQSLLAEPERHRPFAGFSWRAGRSRWRRAKREVPVHLGIASRNAVQTVGASDVRTGHAAGQRQSRSGGTHDGASARAPGGRPRRPLLRRPNDGGASGQGEWRVPRVCDRCNLCRHLRRSGCAAGRYRTLRDDCRTRDPAHAGVRGAASRLAPLAAPSCATSLGERCGSPRSGSWGARSLRRSRRGACPRCCSTSARSTR